MAEVDPYLAQPSLAAWVCHRGRGNSARAVGLYVWLRRSRSQVPSWRQRKRSCVLNTAHPGDLLCSDPGGHLLLRSIEQPGDVHDPVSDVHAAAIRTPPAVGLQFLKQRATDRLVTLR